eukprot:scaffold448094_cov17-Prasinocladus_malaysianus.AAC.1
MATTRTVSSEDVHAIPGISEYNTSTRFSYGSNFRTDYRLPTQKSAPTEAYRTILVQALNPVARVLDSILAGKRRVWACTPLVRRRPIRSLA